MRLYLIRKQSCVVYVGWDQSLASAALLLIHLLTQVVLTSSTSLRWPADGTSAHLLLRKPLILRLSVDNEKHDHIFSLCAFATFLRRWVLYLDLWCGFARGRCRISKEMRPYENLIFYYHIKYYNNFKFSMILWEILEDHFHCPTASWPIKELAWWLFKRRRRDWMHDKPLQSEACNGSRVALPCREDLLCLPFPALITCCFQKPDLGRSGVTSQIAVLQSSWVTFYLRMSL